MKPNGIGLAGAILNYVACGIVVVIAMIFVLPLVMVTQTDIWGNEIGSTFNSFLSIIFILMLAYGLMGIILTIRFQRNAEKKILIGTLSILFGFTNIVGIVSGILILASTPE